MATYLYGYSFALNTAKQVKSITLPSDGKINILAITLAPVAPPAGTPVNISGSFGRETVVTDGTTFPNTGGQDGGGHAYSSNLLGSTVSWNGLTFNLGAANANNGVADSGQTLSLPAGSYASLNFLAAAGYYAGSNLTFTVTYSDNSTQMFTQSFSTWTSPQSYAGESTAVTMAYQDTSSGGRNTVATYLYGYSFALNTAKQVKSITLPSDGKINILAITLAPVQNMSMVQPGVMASDAYGGASAPSGTASTPVSLVGKGPAVEPFSGYSSLFAFLSEAKGSLVGQNSAVALPPTSSLSPNDLAFLPRHPSQFQTSDRSRHENSTGSMDNWDSQVYGFDLENSNSSESLTPPNDGAI